MPLAFVLDEHLRGPLWNAIVHHNAGSAFPIDVVRVGDIPDLPLGASDPEILAWAAAEQRIAVSLDVGTMPGHLAAHLAAGYHSPGVFLVRRRHRRREIVEFLALAAWASEAHEWQDDTFYIPLY